MKVEASKSKSPVAATKPIEAERLAYQKDKMNKNGQIQTGFSAYGTLPLTNGYSPAPAPSGCSDIAPIA